MYTEVSIPGSVDDGHGGCVVIGWFCTEVSIPGSVDGGHGSRVVMGVVDRRRDLGT